MENIFRSVFLPFVPRENSQKTKHNNINLQFCQKVDFVHNNKLLSPVEVCELPSPPAVIQVIEEVFVLSIQADVVGDREGFLGKAGDAVHHIVSAEVHPEVIPMTGLPSYNLHPLEHKTPGELWRQKNTWPGSVSKGFPARSSHCLISTTLLLKSRDHSWHNRSLGMLLWLGQIFHVVWFGYCPSHWAVPAGCHCRNLGNPGPPAALAMWHWIHRDLWPPGAAAGVRRDDLGHHKQLWIALFG